MPDELPTMTRAAMLSLVADEIARALFMASRIFLPAGAPGAFETWESLKPIDKANYARRAEHAILDLDVETARLGRLRTSANVASLARYQFGDEIPELPEGFIAEIVESAIQGYGLELSKVWASTTRTNRFLHGVGGQCANCHDVLFGHYDGSAECLNCGLIRGAE